MTGGIPGDKQDARGNSTFYSYDRAGNLVRLEEAGENYRFEMDRLGRETRKSVRANDIERGGYAYQWGVANRLLAKENELTGATSRYDYDRFDFLIREENHQAETHLDTIYRMPDRIGNLYATPEKKIGITIHFS